MKSNCKKCSEIFAPIYKYSIFLVKQPRNIQKSKIQKKRVYDKKREVIGYICLKCGTIEIFTQYYTKLKKTTKEVKP